MKALCLILPLLCIPSLLLFSAEPTSGHVTTDSEPILPNTYTNTTVEDPLSHIQIEEPPTIALSIPSHDYNVGIYDFTALANIDQTEEQMTPASTVTSIAEAWCSAPLQLPAGVTLNAMHFYGKDIATKGGMIMELRKKENYTN